MSLSLLLLGFILGMRHATEADHVAAMATLVGRGHGLRSTALQGAAWGLGHTITLLLFGGIALLVGGVIPEHYAQALEATVGVMLVILGLDLLRRLRQRHIHFHVHQHAGGVRHFHAHSHPPGAPHDAESHHHEHEQHLPRRALLVGLMHGLAGSAALVLLAAESTHSAYTGLLYILVFGTGSILGMAALSVVIMLPMRRLQATGMTRAHGIVQLGLGLVTIGLGAQILWDNLSALA
ncbi:MAG: urease accessory protein [Gammaproteobacteria bacterium]|nr:MAG: urease accessory protein [Gammaproteobacteria bacterium]